VDYNIDLNQLKEDSYNENSKSVTFSNQSDENLISIKQE